jgi:hypothetical protein
MAADDGELFGVEGPVEIADEFRVASSYGRGISESTKDE